MNKKIALFFDCENVPCSHLGFILNELNKYGKVIIKQSFKDWRYDNEKSWNQDIHDRFGIEPIQVLKSKGGKNSLDLRLQRAVIETMNKGIVDAIAIVSSDSDFRDLAINLNGNDIFSIGFGESKTLSPLRNAYSVFIEVPQTKASIQSVKQVTQFPVFTNLPQQPKSAQANLATKQTNVKMINSEIIKVLKKAVKDSAGKNGLSKFGAIATYLKNINFNYKDYGVVKLSNLFKKYPNHLKLELVGGQMFVKIRK